MRDKIKKSKSKRLINVVDFISLFPMNSKQFYFFNTGLVLFYGTSTDAGY